MTDFDPTTVTDRPRIPGLKLLAPNELPRPGLDYVLWIEDAEEKPFKVRVAAHVTEDQYAEAEVAATYRWVQHYEVLDIGLNAKGDYDEVPIELRIERAEKHARWKYRGYVAGQISRL